MDSLTPNSNTTLNITTTTNNQEQEEPFSSFLQPQPSTSSSYFMINHPLSNLNPASMNEPSSSTQPQPPPPPPPTKPSKKRTRASRRAPTTVLTTDASNFRSMVQQFTGFPTPPFPPPLSSASSSSLPPFFLPVRPPPSSLVDSIAAISAAINRNAGVENPINVIGGTTDPAGYPIFNPTAMHSAVLAPQFGDSLGGSSGSLPSWVGCGDLQDHDSDNIHHELRQPPHKRRSTRGAEGVVRGSWSTSSSD